jgi:flagellar basal-body rod protein FlgB
MNPITSTLESYLKLTTMREQTIAANMANVDTPGYHTRDIDFQQELSRAMSHGEGQLENASYTPASQEVQGLLERPDGNNVSLDREGLLMSETQLQYQTGVQLLKDHFHQLMSAINGGN